MAKRPPHPGITVTPRPAVKNSHPHSVQVVGPSDSLPIARLIRYNDARRGRTTRASYLLPGRMTYPA